MKTVTALKRDGRTIPLIFHVPEMGERERWYAALVAAECEKSFTGAEHIDIGYTGATDMVIISAPNCERLVSEVRIGEPQVVRVILGVIGFGYEVADLGDTPCKEALRNPFAWAAESAAV